MDVKLGSGVYIEGPFDDWHQYWYWPVDSSIITQVSEESLIGLQFISHHFTVLHCEVLWEPGYELANYVANYTIKLRTSKRSSELQHDRSSEL